MPKVDPRQPQDAQPARSRNLNGCHHRKHHHKKQQNTQPHGTATVPQANPGHPQQESQTNQRLGPKHPPVKKKKKIFKTKQKRPSKFKRFFLKRYTSFSYGHTKTSHKNQNNSVKYQNPDETGIREYPNRIRLNHRRGSRTARIRPPLPGAKHPPPPPAAGCPPVEGPTGDSCQAAKCPPASLTSGQEASIPRESRTGARADPDGR